MSARNPMVGNAGRATVVAEKSSNGKKLKKNIIKQRAGKNTVGGAGNIFPKKQSGFTSTATLKTRNHFESMSPKRDVETVGGIPLNTNSILKKTSIDQNQGSAP